MSNDIHLLPYNLAIAVDSSDSSDESDWVDITALSSRTVDKINDKFDHSHLSAIIDDPSGVVGRERMGTAFPRKKLSENGVPTREILTYIYFYYCY